MHIVATHTQINAKAEVCASSRCSVITWKRQSAYVLHAQPRDQPESNHTCLSESSAPQFLHAPRRNPTRSAAQLPCPFGLRCALPFPPSCLPRSDLPWRQANFCSIDCGHCANNYAAVSSLCFRHARCMGRRVHQWTSIYTRTTRNDQTHRWEKLNCPCVGISSKCRVSRCRQCLHSKHIGFSSPS